MLATSALLLSAGALAQATPQQATDAERQIRAQRDLFNAALAKGDLTAIAAVLTENTQIMTGANSLVFAGRAGQIGMWLEDFQAPSRGIYVRTPERVHVSPLSPMAMETGHWRGVDSKSAKDWSAGDYSAKWRRVDGKWLIEGETYMTTACGGSYCPKKTW